MELIRSFIDVILHMDTHLNAWVTEYGAWIYTILFLVIFLETGVVIFPFLPGDSLLFAAGAIGAMGSMNMLVLYILLLVAAIAGDTLNYWIGAAVGPKAFSSSNRFLKKEYLQKAQSFYEKYGGKAIILSRFVPIVRTFAPFVAGIGTMNYAKFLSYNVIGGIVWVTIFLWGGYFLGNIPFIKENFHYSVVLILVVSVIPIIIEYIKAKQEKK